MLRGGSGTGETISPTISSFFNAREFAIVYRRTERCSLRAGTGAVRRERAGRGFGMAGGFRKSHELFRTQ
ncbi:hypothetical protein SBA2_740037 [Acidobacteriia bacterium SbA2]|nr:hypothetical protein SBA2_740037 [Acidobacteriia bacterium SbA2]